MANLGVYTTSKSGEVVRKITLVQNVFHYESMNRLRSTK